MKTAIKLIVFIVFGIGLILSTTAQPGMLDESFGTEGKVTVSFGNSGDWGRSVLVQTDGKIIVVGETHTNTASIDYALARFNVDGSLDNTFDYDGKVTTDFSNYQDHAYASVLQPDGKIVVAGVTMIYMQPVPDKSFGIVRYNPDGSLDNLFGSGGLVSVSFLDEQASPLGIALQSDGKVIVVGWVEAANSSSDIAIVRLNIDGSLDDTFGTGGKVTTDYFGDNEYASCVAVQTNGKIVVAGVVNDGTPYGDDFAIVRYNSDGSQDNTFGTGGLIATDFFGYPDAANSIIIQPDGKIVAGGYCRTTQNIDHYDFALARYTPDGNFDNSFDYDGKVNSNFINEYPDRGYSLVLQEDGKIILAGATIDAGDHDNFGMFRYNTDGSNDMSFGFLGGVILDFDESFDYCYAAAIQPDSKIVLAGFKLISGQSRSFAVARFMSGLETGVLSFTESRNLVDVYPNPIGETATLRYELQQEETITISCYDVQGKLVQTFISNQFKQAGKHQVVLNFDSSFPTGYYNLVISNGCNQHSIRIVKN